MKFKWIGGNGFKSIDLVLYKIMAPNEQLYTGKIIEVPDDLTVLIERIKINGNFEVYNEPKKGYNKPSKNENKKNEKKKTKEE